MFVCLVSLRDPLSVDLLRQVRVNGLDLRGPAWFYWLLAATERTRIWPRVLGLGCGKDDDGRFFIEGYVGLLQGSIRQRPY